MHSKLIAVFHLKNTPNDVDLCKPKSDEMKQYRADETIRLRRKLTKLKHVGLKGLSYVNAQIFKACETADCGSYVCNLSTGRIQEAHGLVTAFQKLETVEDIDKFTHPSDRRKIYEVLEALCELGKEKTITSYDRLTLTYRIKFHQNYMHVIRKSGLAVNELTGDVLNWSNLYALPDLHFFKGLAVHWAGNTISNAELKHFFTKKKEKVFTSSEFSILSSTQEGLTTVEIADSLNISPETVRKHFSNMFKKTETKSRIQLLKLFEGLEKDEEY